VLCREFAMLDAMLLIGTPCEVTYSGGGRFIDMIGRKKYLQQRDMLLNAVHDLAGLQKAATLISDSSRGNIHLLVKVYESEWEYRIIVEPRYYIEDITLARGLPAGEYKAIMRILAFAQDDFTALNSVSAEFNLFVTERGE